MIRVGDVVQPNLQRLQDTLLDLFWHGFIMPAFVNPTDPMLSTSACLLGDRSEWTVAVDANMFMSAHRVSASPGIKS